MLTKLRISRLKVKRGTLMTITRETGPLSGLQSVRGPKQTWLIADYLPWPSWRHFRTDGSTEAPDPEERRYRNQELYSNRKGSGEEWNHLTEKVNWREWTNTLPEWYLLIPISPVTIYTYRWYRKSTICLEM